MPRSERRLGSVGATPKRGGVGALLAATLLGASLPALQSGAQPAGPDSPIGYALEHLVSGVPATVHVGETSYVITPLRTWRSVSGHWCRRYEMTVTQPGAAPSSSRATRCRDDGLWLEPAPE